MLARKRVLQSQGRNQTKLQKVAIIGNQLYSQLGGSLIGSGRLYCSGGYIYLVAWKKCKVRLCGAQPKTMHVPKND
jgi:hypothetical protein